jgi:hypothetical protein
MKELKIRNIIDKLDEAICDASKEILLATINCNHDAMNTEEGCAISQLFEEYDITDPNLYSDFQDKLKALTEYCYKHGVEIV